MEGTKLCKVCGERKLLENFIKDSRNKNGRGAWCLPCKRNHSKSYAKANPDKYKKWQSKYDRKRRYTKYGLTDEEFAELVESSKRSCEICGYISQTDDLRDLSIDHDHSSGIVRGMLCNNCNTAIGLLKDSPELLARAIRYLKKQTPSPHKGGLA